MSDLFTIKTKSLNDNIPIVRDATGDVIVRLINDNAYRSILELGTAYGYSACLFSLNKNIERIVSVEKNNVRYQIAFNFLKDNKKINLINDDLFTYEPHSTFDLIFVDGPKSHQREIVNKYLQYLNDGGKMVIDNIFLKKFTNQTPLTHNQQKLINKVNDFRKWLNECKLNVKILDIDDGVAIISKSN